MTTGEQTGFEKPLIRQASRRVSCAVMLVLWALVAWTVRSAWEHAREIGRMRRIAVAPDRENLSVWTARYLSAESLYRGQAALLAEMEYWRSGRMPWDRVLAAIRTAVPPGVEVTTVRVRGVVERSESSGDGVSAWRYYTLQVGGSADPGALVEYVRRMEKQPVLAAHWDDWSMENLVRDRARPEHRLFAVGMESKRNKWK